MPKTDKPIVVNPQTVSAGANDIRPIFAAEAVLMAEEPLSLSEPKPLSTSVFDKPSVAGANAPLTATSGLSALSDVAAQPMPMAGAEQRPLTAFAQIAESMRVTEAGASDPVSGDTTFQAATETSKPATKLGEAILAQIKSVSLEEGRTQIALKPAGLGQLEIVIQNTEDSASKVVVKVENPMVLSNLREDRHVLAQAIGVTDDSQLEFQGGFANEGGGDNEPSQGNSRGSDITITPDVAVASQGTVIEDTELDLVT